MTNDEHIAYLSLASNIDPETHLLQALELLAGEGIVEAVSTFYRTAPLERPEQADYYNGVCRFRCRQAVRELKTAVLRPIEGRLHRVRSDDRSAARTIDLDILLFDRQVIRELDLEVPDPEILTRPFLAAGLLELDPVLILPGTGKRLVDLLSPGAAALPGIPLAAFTTQMRLRCRALMKNGSPGWSGSS